MAQRIKGQEVEILLLLNGEPLVSLFDIRSFEVALIEEILNEGYLGETTNRRDSIFRGVRGRFEAHVENADFLRFYTAVVDKGRRRIAGTTINVKVTLNFPNGDRPRILIPDIEFGDLPLNFGSRSDYGTASIDFEAAEASIIS